MLSTCCSTSVAKILLSFYYCVCFTFMFLFFYHTGVRWQTSSRKTSEETITDERGTSQSSEIAGIRCSHYRRRRDRVGLRLGRLHTWLVRKNYFIKVIWRRHSDRDDKSLKLIRLLKQDSVFIFLSRFIIDQNWIGRVEPGKHAFFEKSLSLWIRIKSWQKMEKKKTRIEMQWNCLLGFVKFFSVHSENTGY